MTEFVPLSTIDAMAVEVLLDHAFGLDRHQRTAYRIRGGGAPIAALSFAAKREERLVGTIQCWPVVLRADDGPAVPLVMVGPVAVAPNWQLGGIGRALVHHALDAAMAERLDDRLMLIGDPEYYGRFFGFDAARTGRWRAPGPVEMRRLLARGDAVPDVAGMLGPPDGRR